MYISKAMLNAATIQSTMVKGGLEFAFLPLDDFLFALSFMDAAFYFLFR